MRRKPEIRAGRNDPPRPNGIGEWRSPVARLLWEQDVAGSNPVSPTILFTAQVSQISAPTVQDCAQVAILASARRFFCTYGGRTDPKAEAILAGPDHRHRCLSAAVASKPNDHPLYSHSVGRFADDVSGKDRRVLQLARPNFRGRRRTLDGRTSPIDSSLIEEQMADCVFCTVAASAREPIASIRIARERGGGAVAFQQGAPGKSGNIVAVLSGIEQRTGRQRRYCLAG
jgi:hypothetical protein